MGARASVGHISRFSSRTCVPLELAARHRGRSTRSTSGFSSRGCVPLELAARHRGGPTRRRRIAQGLYRPRASAALPLDATPLPLFAARRGAGPLSLPRLRGSLMKCDRFAVSMSSTTTELIVVRGVLGSPGSVREVSACSRHATAGVSAGVGSDVVCGFRFEFCSCRVAVRN